MWWCDTTGGVKISNSHIPYVALFCWGQFNFIFHEMNEMETQSIKIPLLCSIQLLKACEHQTHPKSSALLSTPDFRAHSRLHLKMCFKCMWNSSNFQKLSSDMLREKLLAHVNTQEYDPHCGICLATANHFTVHFFPKMQPECRKKEWEEKQRRTWQAPKTATHSSDDEKHQWCVQTCVDTSVLNRNVCV